jgi:hypothetical protein
MTFALLSCPCTNTLTIVSLLQQCTQVYGNAHPMPDSTAAATSDAASEAGEGDSPFTVVPDVLKFKASRPVYPLRPAAAVSITDLQ